MREGDSNKNTGGLSWRKPNHNRPPPQLVPMPKTETRTIPRGAAKHDSAWKDKNNWRSSAVPPADDLSKAKTATVAAEANGNGNVNGARLSQSLGNQNHLQVPARGRVPGPAQPSPNSWKSGFVPLRSNGHVTSIKPSTMGNGIIGRSTELSTSPKLSKSPPTIGGPWSATDSSLPPATNLSTLKIGGFQATGSREGHHSLHHQLTNKERDENWMLTPTSSLPSLPGTPHKHRDHSMDRDYPERQRAPDAGGGSRTSHGRQHDARRNDNSSNESPLPRNQVDQFQMTFQQAPRTPSPGFASTFANPSSGPGPSSFLGRALGGQLHSSPKRSPLSISNRTTASGTVHAPPAYVYAQNASTAAAASPGSSPKMLNRTLSPIARLPSIDAEGEEIGVLGPTSIASVLAPGVSSQKPNIASRRDSFNSTSSAQGGHTMSRSRRSSQILSPSSPTGSYLRIGVYRPPHLRNRDSVSGLRPTVAHYDRVSTPTLRGLSRSRESSVSLSRPGSRPPSTVPFLRSDTIPEHGTPDSTRLPPRGRLSSFSSYAGSTIDDPGAVGPSPLRALPENARQDYDQGSRRAFHDRQIGSMTLDGASLVAKLEEQTNRDRAFPDAEYWQEADSNEDDDDGSQEFFDISAEDMMGYGASEGHPLSRHGSLIDGRPLREVFEIGDRLGPGLEHDGHVIQIAETTPGFQNQKADLTGSQLEVIRKLGEGSYATVYLVREVMPEGDNAGDREGAFGFADEGDGDGLAARSARQGSAPPVTNGDRSYNCAVALIEDGDQTMIVDSEDLLGTTLKARIGSHQNTSFASPSLEQRRRKDLQASKAVPKPKEFALKCLCKRDLPEELLEVQRLEATIHQAIPAHPNIVTLYRTYETADWLFLIMEYCPGQDLYYWLEQAQDTNESGPHGGAGKHEEDGVNGHHIRQGKSPGFSEDEGSFELSTSFDATPPSPSLLASTACGTLLSRRRVRLIARMFRQICDAVQFCHDRGISHRDIKPENFIVEDRRYAEDSASFDGGDQSFSTIADSLRDIEARVIVKMMDFGLATAEDRCDDFDCGSKPYMAFECHNNISTNYDPKQADVWSLGVVLLNLLFHRSPFTEPSQDCPSFSAYCYDPVRFLMESFDGLTETVACFLAENVFCSVSDESEHVQRVTAGEFSQWACGLVDHLGLSGSGPGRISRGASMYATTPLIHSRTASMSTLPSLLSSPRARPRSVLREPSLGPGLDYNHDSAFRSHYLSSRYGSISPHPALETPDMLPSPRFTPSPRPNEKNPFDLQYASVSPQPQSSPESMLQAVKAGASHSHNQVDDDTTEAKTLSTDPDESRDRAEVDAMLQCQEALVASTEAFKQAIREEITSASASTVDQISKDVEAPSVQAVKPAEHKQAGAGAAQASGVDPSSEAKRDDPIDTPAESADQSLDPEDVDADADVDVDADPASSVANSNHSKRRKRGARKGRTLAKQLKRSQSVEHLSQLGGETRAKEREATIKELALASETLARQMSKMHPKASGGSASYSPALQAVSLSPPTAAAAAKYTLQNLASSSKASETATGREGTNGAAIPRVITPFQLDAAEKASQGSSESSSVATSSSNWSSAALRRERINERKAGGALPLLQDSGRTRPMSWRERNQSTTTFSSLASNTTMSSFSSASSETSSIYSTSSAPAALTKRDLSSRSRSRASGLLSNGLGLDTISEKKKEVDASYLAGIFGGDEARAAEKRKRELQQKVAAADAERQKENLMALLQEQDRSNKKDKEASVSPRLSSPKMNGESETASSSASFVSRFRRPGSSSSSKSNGNPGSALFGFASSSSANSSAITTTTIAPGAAAADKLRDASTSTGSLNREEDKVVASHLGSAPTEIGIEGLAKASASAGSVDDVGKLASEAAPALKKRGMGKFFLGMRDSIMNR